MGPASQRSWRVGVHRRPFRGALLGVGFAVLVSACAMAGRGRAERVPNEPETFVEVQNQSWLDVNVFVLRGAQQVRLGTVEGATTRRLRIPSTLLFGPTPLRFRIDPIGSGRAPVSQEILVSPGETVRLVVPP
mgnify:FL=1